MAAFLSKVFSRKDKDKKGDEKVQLSVETSKPNKRLSVHSQSDAPLVPSKEKDKDKERSGLALFRPKSHSQAKSPASPRSRSRASTGPNKHADDVPHLTLNLNLPGLKGGASADSPTVGLGLGLGLAASGQDGEQDLRAVLSEVQIDDAVLGETRLSPAEALVLLNACAKVITARGLDTLGIMHPHWYSASPAAQRRIIALFVNTLSPPTRSSPTSPATASTTPTSPASATAAFISELDFTRNPHDVAAVFRWALRHLKLDGTCFDGKTVSTSTTGSSPKHSSSLGWYDSFAANERSQYYPPKALSELLLPNIPRQHADLLVATTGLISSLAAHSESNGVSGSKLAMVFGHYLLTGNRVEGGQGDWVEVRRGVGREGVSLDAGSRIGGTVEDGWVDFYRRWERSGRALEHLFLAYLRDEAASQTIPTRLTELIAGYPYSKNAQQQDGHFLRPRFTTRSYDALFVRVAAQVPSDSKDKDAAQLQHPLRLVMNALKSDLKTPAKGDDDLENEATPKDEWTAVWEEIRTLAIGAVKAEEGREVLHEGDAEGEHDQVLLSKVLSDDSIRLLSLRPLPSNRGRGRFREKSEGTGTPTITKFAPEDLSKGMSTQNGRANGKADGMNGSATASGISKSTTESSSPSSPVGADWNIFSSAGFGDSAPGRSLAASLVDGERGRSGPGSRRPSKKGSKAARSPSRAKVSEAGTKDAPRIDAAKALEDRPTFATTAVTRVSLDEAFVDFWCDALLDPVSSAWPVFVVAQLRATPAADAKLGWLVVEQVSSAQPTRPSREGKEPPSSVRRATSPKPSFRSETSTDRRGPVGRLSLSSTFSATRKRFGLFAGEAKESVKEEKEDIKGGKKAKGARVNELGEIIPEGSTSSPVKPKAAGMKTESKPALPRAEEAPKPVEKLDMATAGTAAVIGAAAGTAAATALSPAVEKAQQVVSTAEEKALPTPAEEKALPAVQEEKTEAAETLAPPAGGPAIVEAEKSTEEPKPVAEVSAAAEPEQATAPHVEPAQVSSLPEAPKQAAPEPDPAAEGTPSPAAPIVDVKGEEATDESPVRSGADSEPLSTHAASGEVKDYVAEEEPAPAVPPKEEPAHEPAPIPAPAAELASIVEQPAPAAPVTEPKPRIVPADETAPNVPAEEPEPAAVPKDEPLPASVDEPQIQVAAPVVPEDNAVPTTEETHQAPVDVKEEEAASKAEAPTDDAEPAPAQPSAATAVVDTVRDTVTAAVGAVLPTSDAPAEAQDAAAVPGAFETIPDDARQTPEAVTDSQPALPGNPASKAPAPEPPIVATGADAAAEEPTETPKAPTPEPEPPIQADEPTGETSAAVDLTEPERVLTPAPLAGADNAAEPPKASTPESQINAISDPAADEGQVVEAKEPELPSPAPVTIEEVVENEPVSAEPTTAAADEPTAEPKDAATAPAPNSTTEHSKEASPVPAQEISDGDSKA